MCPRGPRSEPIISRVLVGRANTGRIEDALTAHHEALQLFENQGDMRGMEGTLDLLSDGKLNKGLYKMRA